MRILLVDDDVMTRKVLSRFLLSAGHDVETCADGIEALDRFRSQPRYDLLVTDYVMPSMSGLDLLRTARELEIAPPRCIVITGQNLSDEIRAGASVSAWFDKPVELEDLLRAIEEP